MLNVIKTLAHSSPTATYDSKLAFRPIASMKLIAVTDVAIILYVRSL